MTYGIHIPHIFTYLQIKQQMIANVCQMPGAQLLPSKLLHEYPNSWNPGPRWSLDASWHNDNKLLLNRLLNTLLNDEPMSNNESHIWTNMNQQYHTISIKFHQCAWSKESENQNQNEYNKFLKLMQSCLLTIFSPGLIETRNSLEVCSSAWRSW